MAPFFSIIIPSYNRANIILKTLNSVFKQTFLDYEIIVVDNCSTDDTVSVLEPLVNKGKISFIQHDKNYERAKSRNTGLNTAKGLYVTFLDSDDLLHTTCLEEVFLHIKQSGSKFTYVDHEFVSFDDEDHPKTISTYKRPITSDHKKNIITGNFLACIGVFVHKDIYESYKFNELPQLTGSEDWFFWLNVIAKYSEITHLNKILCSIVEHSGRTVNQQNINDLIDRRKLILNLIRKSPELSLAYGRHGALMRSSSDLYIASNASGQGHKKQALKYFFKAIIGYPRFIFSKRVLAVMKNFVTKW